MSTDRDVTRIVQSWLEEGVTALPDRVLDAVLDQVPATPQRRSWWPAWRLPQMNTRLGIAAALAAVVVVALIAINLVPKTASVGGPPATASPTAKLAPSPTPIALYIGESGGQAALNPGTYVATSPFLAPFTFTAPAGWVGNVGGPFAVFLNQQNGSGVLNFVIFNDVYADPCNNKKGLLKPLPGPTVDDLASALAGLPGLSPTTPTAVTIAGYQGKQLTLTAPANFAGCTLSSDGQYRVWQLPLGVTNFLTPLERDQVWILNVRGQRLVIESHQVPRETAQQIAEVQAILDSVRFAPAASSPSTAPTASSTAVSPTP